MVRIGPSFGPPSSPESKEPVGKSSFQPIRGETPSARTQAPNDSPKQRIDDIVKQLEKIYGDIMTNLTKKPPSYVSIDDLNKIFGDAGIFAQAKQELFQDPDFKGEAARTDFDAGINKLRDLYYLVMNDDGKNPKSFSEDCERMINAAAGYFRKARDEV